MPGVTHHPVFVLLLVAVLVDGCGAPDGSSSASAATATTTPAAPTSSIEAVPTLTPPRCPALVTSDPPTHVETTDGTTFDLVASRGADGAVRCSLVASRVHGVSGSGWQTMIDRDWEPSEVVVEANGTVYLFLVSLTEFTFDGPVSRRLLVVGPEGIRADVPTVWNLEKAPSGTLYLLSEDVQPNGIDARSSLAALGPDGLPQTGWPYMVDGYLSWPTFGRDGTAYAAQFTSAGWALLALTPTGKVKAGWPYTVPGGPPVGAPRIAPDGSLYGGFADGIFVVRPDGRAKAGWPYVMPSGTHREVAVRGGLGAEEFDPTMTPDGRIFLPVARDSGTVAKDDVLCLRSDGTSCPGWPRRLPEGWAVMEMAIDGQGVVQLVLVAWGRPEPIRDSYTRVSIGPDGTLFHRVEAGDTVSVLADAYGVTQAALLAANPQVTDPSHIPLGDVLFIP
jgi:hypothetical protein